MPDTPRLLRPEQMQAIREQEFTDGDVTWAVSRLLAHIDALTAAVEDFVAFLNTYDEDGHPHASGEAKERAAILRGVQSHEDRWRAGLVDPVATHIGYPDGTVEELDLDDPVVREAQVYGGDDRARHVMEDRE